MYIRSHCVYFKERKHLRSFALKGITLGSSLCGSAVNEPKQDPRGHRFDPWPRSVGEGSCVVVSCGVGCRGGSDPALQWLWCRPAATAPIGPLAWEPPCAAGAAIKKKRKRRKRNKRKRKDSLCSQFRVACVKQKLH